MNKIPIVISSDNRIFFTVGVVLTSLLENAKSDTFYDINVFYTSDVTDENINKLKTSLNKYKNKSLNLFDMGDKFKDIPSTKGYHVNYVSAYKMLVPSMFPQYDRLIYLDTDILVRGDLTELYNFDIGDNYFASTPVFSNILLRYEYICNLLNIPDLDFYVNAGVMLMNLKKIRDDKIDEKWISLLGSFEGSVDQHILNKVCYGKTTYLPLKYNTCLSELNIYKSDDVHSYYSQREVNEALDNPIIFHWTGKQKPWLYRDTFLAQEWLKYFSKTNFYTVLNRSNCYILKYKNDFKNIRYHTLFSIIPLVKIVETHKKSYFYLFNIVKIYKIFKSERSN